MTRAGRSCFNRPAPPIDGKLLNLLYGPASAVNLNCLSRASFREIVLLCLSLRISFAVEFLNLNGIEYALSLNAESVKS